MRPGSSNPISCKNSSPSSYSNSAISASNWLHMGKTIELLSFAYSVRSFKRIFSSDISSTLPTYRHGFTVINPNSLKISGSAINELAFLPKIPELNSSDKVSNFSFWIAISLSPDLEAFSSLVSALSKVSISERSNSVSTVSRSTTGSILSWTWVISWFSKHLITWIMA